MKRETMIERHIRKVIELIDVASIAKKIVLALLGLFLITFLLVHLGLNLTILRNDGGEWFRAGAYFMGSNFIVKILGFGILAAILGHIALGFLIQFLNWRARPIGYKVRTKSKTMFGSRLMIWTGILLGVLIVVHLTHFWFVKQGWAEGRYIIRTEKVERAFGARTFELQNAFQNAVNEDQQMRIETEFMELHNFIQGSEKLQVAFLPGFAGQRFIVDLSKEDIAEIRSFLDVAYKADFWAMMHDMFKNIWMVLLYVFFSIVLGIHLAHAIPSGFQTLGLAHSKYTFIVKYAGYGLAAIIAIGFAFVPLFIYFFR
ncbi:MAG: succinate dehydrogenase cytochrome b subunit [Bacteroidales bacterium]|nr:succinate dehydrogenase cytochrome b subunit [Bacteroidales bacterium]